MIDPLTNAGKLYREAYARLLDDETDIDVFTLTRWLRDGHAALDGADREGYALAWSLIGLTEARLAVAGRDTPDAVRLRAALDAYRNVLHATPTDPHVAVQAGRVLGWLGREQEALGYFEQAIRHSRPGSESYFIAHVNQAAAHHYAGRDEEADEVFDRVVRLVDPANARDLFRIANSAAVLGRDGDAVELLARGLAAEQKIDRGDGPAVDVVASAPAELRDRVLRRVLLRDAYGRVLDLWRGPLPDDAVSLAKVTLPAEAWARFLHVARLPLDPTPA